MGHLALHFQGYFCPKYDIFKVTFTIVLQITFGFIPLKPISQIKNKKSSSLWEEMDLTQSSLQGRIWDSKAEKMVNNIQILEYIYRTGVTGQPT